MACIFSVNIEISPFLLEVQVKVVIIGWQFIQIRMSNRQLFISMIITGTGRSWRIVSNYGCGKETKFGGSSRQFDGIWGIWHESRDDFKSFFLVQNTLHNHNLHCEMCNLSLNFDNSISKLVMSHFVRFLDTKSNKKSEN